MDTQTNPTTPATPDTRFHPSKGVRCLYLRNRHGVPVGLIMAITGEDGTVRAGWSVCDRTDRFLRKQAKEIAFGRAQPLPSVSMDLGELTDTPMNRVLVAFGNGLVPVPSIVAQNARRAARARSGRD